MRHGQTGHDENMAVLILLTSPHVHRLPSSVNDKEPFNRVATGIAPALDIRDRNAEIGRDGKHRDCKASSDAVGKARQSRRY